MSAILKVIWWQNWLSCPKILKSQVTERRVPAATTRNAVLKSEGLGLRGLKTAVSNTRYDRAAAS